MRYKGTLAIVMAVLSHSGVAIAASGSVIVTALPWMATGSSYLASVNGLQTQPSTLESGMAILRREEVRVLAGGWLYDSDTISIRGQAFDGFGRLYHKSNFVVFDVRGWDRLEVWVGIPDAWTDCRTATVSIEVDGEQVWQKTVRYGDKPEWVAISLRGKQTLSFQQVGGDFVNEVLSGCVFATPRLYRNTALTVPANPMTPQANPSAQIVFALFTVDPNNVGQLVKAVRMAAFEVVSLRYNISGKPYTGLVVDCRGLNLRRSMAPKIRRADGSEVWGTVQVDPDFVIQHGIVVYVDSRQPDLLGSPEIVERIGNNPLVIRATGVAGAALTDPVITNEDAERLLEANRQHGFLNELRVVFVQ